LKNFPARTLLHVVKKINPYSNLNFQRRISVVLKAHEYELILLADPAEGNICECALDVTREIHGHMMIFFSDTTYKIT